MTRRLMVGVTMTGLLHGGPASAVEAFEVAGLRDVVGRQIEALGRDDAAAAYALASPGIQALFSSPDTFIDMVRNQYAPVYRPGEVTFGPVRESASGPELMVHLKDTAGVDWDAIYTFEQAGTAWTISGCRLVKSPGDSV